MLTFSMDFQATPRVDGSLSDGDQDFLRREAFPLSPPYAPEDQDTPWRAYKLVPMTGDRILVSVASDRQKTDSMGRPVLSATGVVAPVEAFTGPLRDVGGLWRVLDHLSEDAPPTAEAITAEVARASPLLNPQRHAQLVEQCASQGEFLARAAAALTNQPGVDLVLPSDARARRSLQPVLLLVPLDRLMTLHLATGSIRSNRREPILATPVAPPAPKQQEPESKGVFGSIFQRGRPPTPEPPPTRHVIDFVRGRVRGGHAPPMWLVDLITSSSTWPELSGMDRLRLVLRCADARALGHSARSVFTASPALAELQRLVHALEAADRDIEQWT